MKKWFVINTKPNKELHIADELIKIGILSFCPAIKVIKQYSDRKKKILKPLISSYLFVYIDEKKRNDVFIIPGITKYFFWQGKPATVKADEINNMRNYIDGLYSEKSIFSMCEGEFYKIPEGPFLGQKGKVIELKNSTIKLKLDSSGIMLTLRKAVA
tara:strand:- start:443 stop:913 length:471 start_codon:yes stop_codon:yes gene_type:complete